MKSSGAVKKIRRVERFDSYDNLYVSRRVLVAARRKAEHYRKTTRGERSKVRRDVDDDFIFSPLVHSPRYLFIIHFFFFSSLIENLSLRFIR